MTEIVFPAPATLKEWANRELKDWRKIEVEALFGLYFMQSSKTWAYMEGLRSGFNGEFLCIRSAFSQEDFLDYARDCLEIIFKREVDDKERDEWLAGYRYGLQLNGKN